MGFGFLGCGETNDENAQTEVLAPEGWNKSVDSYSFRYKNRQSNVTFVIKSLVMGNKLLVHGLGVEDGNIYNTDIDVNDFVNQGIALDNFESLFKNLDNLISTFKIKIINKLVPEGNKEVNQQQQQPQNSSLFLPHPSSSQTQQQPRNTTPQPNRYDPYNDPLRVPNSGRQPRQPISPLMEPGGYGGAFQPPFGLGSNDLYPVPSPFGGPPGPTGNLIGPNHPGFGPNINDPYGGNPFGGNRGRGRGSVPTPPPGARYDPFGPPGHFGEPDRDDFPPPNYDYFL